MAVNKSSKESQDWMALTIWVGLFIGTLVTSIYLLTSINLPGQIIAQSSQSFGQPDLITGALGATSLAKAVLYGDVLLYIAVIYFLVSAWLKLGSMLLEMVIHYSRESSSESVFATMLYLSGKSASAKGFDPDEAEGSMPGDIVRSLAFAWVTAFAIFGLSLALLYVL